MDARSTCISPPSGAPLILRTAYCKTDQAAPADSFSSRRRRGSEDVVGAPFPGEGTAAALVGHIGAAGDAALVAQVQQIAAHVFLVQLIWRAAVIGGERLNALQINFLSRG